MASLTIDPTRPPEKGDLIVIMPDRRVVIVEASDLNYAQASITDVTPPFLRDLSLPPWLNFPPMPTYAIRIDAEAMGCTLMKTGSLKRVLRYLEKQKKEKRKHAQGTD